MVRPATLEGDNPLGIVDCNGECFLLSCVQLPCFFNLTEKNMLNMQFRFINSSQSVERLFVPVNSLTAVPLKEEHTDR